MTMELSEDVVLQVSTPQIMMAESGGGGGGGRSIYSGSVELGRRLLLAARHGQTAQVLDLMAKGAPFTTDWLGTSPLHVAAGGAHAETCAVLLRAGVSRDSRTKVERTPLHLAAHAGHADVVALLLAHGAQVDCRDMLRMTPLHWACARGHAAAAAALLRAGADPLAESKFHKTPLALAAARPHRALVRVLEDALREREAARSVDALRDAAADEDITEIPAAEQRRALESIERLQETVKPSVKQQTGQTEPIKIEIERPPEDGGGPALAAALLRKHGITLLPHDSSSTVLNAIQSGRTVVLSDAGKLMLKESSEPEPPPTSCPTPAPTSKGVILTAAPVKSPPKPGVKIFTLNNKLLAMPKENKVPVKKVVNPQDMQIKFVTLPTETKLQSRARVPLKSPRLRGSVAPAPAPASTTASRPPVKIIMHKANFDKMLGKGTATENGMETAPVTPATELTKVLQGPKSAPGAVLMVPQEFLSSNSVQYLRTQLLSAHQTIHELNKEVATLKQALAKYENV